MVTHIFNSGNLCWLFFHTNMDETISKLTWPNIRIHSHQSTWLHLHNWTLETTFKCIKHFSPIILCPRNIWAAVLSVLGSKLSNEWSAISVRCTVPELWAWISKIFKTSMLSLPTSMWVPGDDVGDFLAKRSITSRNVSQLLSGQANFFKSALQMHIGQNLSIYSNLAVR